MLGFCSGSAPEPIAGDHSRKIQSWILFYFGLCDYKNTFAMATRQLQQSRVVQLSNVTKLDISLGGRHVRVDSLLKFHFESWIRRSTGTIQRNCLKVCENMWDVSDIMTGSIIISTNLQILAKDSRFHQRKSRVQVQAPKKDSANTNVSCKQSECKETGRSGKNACACTCIVLYTYIYIYMMHIYQ